MRSMGRLAKFKIKYICRVIEDKHYFSFFDVKGKLFYPPTDYLIHMVDTLQSSNGTVDNRASTLRVFFQYLSDNNIDYLDVDDEILENYRDHVCSAKRSNAQSNINVRKRSVNAYLRRVYDFYAWVQEEHPQRRILGMGGHHISSTLLERTQKNSGENNYPKCYQNVGESSKHSVGFVPEHEDYTELFDYFLSKRTDVAKRNTLILQIFNQTGLRVGSLSSLTIDQFNEIEINNADKHINIIPAVQKFGYSKSYEIPIILAEQVLDYIKRERQVIVDKYSTPSNRVFLSTTSGNALESTYISNEFNSAAKAIGWNKKGVGPHCWRRRFACDEVTKDLDSSIELGFDTSLEAVGLRLAERLGQNNIESSGAYVRYLNRKNKATAVSILSDDLQIERDKVDAQALEIAELRKMLENRR